MSLIKDIKRLEFVNYLIKRKATGNLEAFARRTKLSKRAMSYFISELRDMGADIRFDKSKQTYFYEQNGEFSICKFIEYGQVISRNEASKISSLDDLCFSERATFIPCKDIE